MALAVLVADLLLGYVIGSFPSGYLCGRLLAGKNVLATGSGNVGGMNVARNVGLLPGLLTGLLDVGKGALAVYLAGRWFPATGAPGVSALPPWSTSPGVPYSPAALAAGVGAVLGHNFMLFLGFRGGKGLGSSLGVFLVLSPMTLVYALPVIAVLVFLLRDTNTAAATGVALVPVILWFQKRDPAWVIFGLGLAVVVVSKHLPDVREYLRGRRQMV